MLGTGIVGPILPLYAKAFGVSYSVVGLVISAFGFARILLDVPAGTLADRWGRRPLLLLGIAIFSATGVIAAFAPNIYYLILARFVQGVGAALFTTSGMAIVGDIAPAGERGRYMSTYQMSFFLGTSTGPAIGGFLAEWGGFALPFLLLSVLSLGGAIFAYIWVQESLAGDDPPTTSPAELLKALHKAARNLFVANLAVLVTFLTLSGIRMMAIPLYGQKVLGLSQSEIGVILALAAFVNIPSLFWSGPMVDRVGSRPIFILGFASATVATYGLTFTHSFLSLAAVATFFGFTTGLNQPAQGRAVLEAADPHHRGMSVGLHRVFGDVGVILGPTLVGILADHSGLASPFSWVAVLCGIMAVASVLIGRPEEIGEEI